MKPGHESQAEANTAGHPKPGRRKMPAQDKPLMEKLRPARDGSPGTAVILALGHDGGAAGGASSLP